MITIGQHIGRYKVLDKLKNYEGFPSLNIWKCVDSSTGEILDIREDVLRKSVDSSRKYERKTLIGQTFGKLKVIRRAILGYNDVFWRCECLCGSGKIRYKKTSDLLKGVGNLSCGCERQKHKYEEKDLPLYVVFKAMKQRCYNYRNKDYPSYGGRGIYIYHKWLNSPIEFIHWANENGYTKGLEIDRIDNDGPYAPWNCRWVKREDQNRNTRANVPITVDGKTHLCAEWSRILGLSKCRVADQLRSSSMNECIHYIREHLRRMQSKTTVGV